MNSSNPNNLFAENDKLLTKAGADLRLPQLVQQLCDSENRSSDEVLRDVAKYLSLPFVDLKKVVVDETLLHSIPAEVLFRHAGIPIELNDDVLKFAVGNPFDSCVQQAIQRASGHLVELLVADPALVRMVLRDNLGLGTGSINEADEDLRKVDGEAILDDDQLANESSTVKVVNELLGDAIVSGASDIHLEPLKGQMGIRYRIDGVLVKQTVAREISGLSLAIISRLKIMAGLNIAEKRRPQDGRFRFNDNGSEVDIRMSTMPMLHGESVVMRLLRRKIDQWGMQFLGLPESQEQTWQNLIHTTSGILLVTGPTGSGKTTTLFHLLSDIIAHRPGAKIITIEDPVEYSLSGVHQIQVNEAAGLTFASGLRGILRHDPDIILLGEIRDQETAKHAIEAALTGHLVLASLHTNDAASAYVRLVEMGVEPFLVASTLVAAAAQRLIRNLCPLCRQPISSPESGDAAGASTADLSYAAVGCSECGMQGYAGRSAVMEILVADNEIRDLCQSQASSQEIARSACKSGMHDLMASGMQKVALGETTFQEVSRVMGDLPYNN